VADAPRHDATDTMTSVTGTKLIGPSYCMTLSLSLSLSLSVSVSVIPSLTNVMALAHAQWNKIRYNKTTRVACLLSGFPAVKELVDRRNSKSKLKLSLLYN